MAFEMEESIMLNMLQLGIYSRPLWVFALLALSLMLDCVSTSEGCPFCTVESRTLSEEISSSDAVVLAKLVKEAPPLDMASSDAANPDAGRATFQVIDVIRGQDRIAAGKEIQVVYFGANELGKVFMITGSGSDTLDWMTPLPLSSAASEYVRKLPTIAAAGAERLVFFQDYLENADPLLAQDAYDEFARAPYAELEQLGQRINHGKLVEWVTSSEVNPSRRRLYLTMLGVCGDKRDLPMLEEMLKSDIGQKKPIVDAMVAAGLALKGPSSLPALSEMVSLDERRKKLGLDAIVACYLTLRGGDGLDLIDERFLTNRNVEYAYVYSTIMALRFHGESTNVLPKPRLLASMRLLLDNPDFADQVIPDLARWEDWSIMDRLVAMFKAGDDKSYIRPPVVTYLTVASEQPGEVGKRAAAAMAELEQLDPESVKKARSMMAFGFLARARASTVIATNTATRADAQASAKPATGSANTGAVAPNDAASAGFGASAGDVAKSDQVSSKSIPDPASFGNANAGAPVAPPPANDKPTLSSNPPLEIDLSAGQPPAPTDQVATQSGATIDSDSPALPPYRKGLAIGLPLAAVAGLVGLFWTILRRGGV
jgi:hypothetical protein